MSELDTVRDLLTIGADVVMSWRGRAIEVERKGSAGDLVTAVDHASEDAMLALLGERFPDDSIISEERGLIAGSSARTWIIDPLDGTVNFAAGSPNFGVIVGLVHGTTPVAGGMVLPAIDRLYLAERGGGATRNGEPVTGSTVTELDHAVVDHSMLWRDDAYNARERQTLDALLPAVRAIRCDHSVRYLADTVEGVLDGFVYHSLGMWDIAGPSVILHEAGVTTSDGLGAPLDMDPGNWQPGRRYLTIGANPALHRTMIDCLNGR